MTGEPTTRRDKKTGPGSVNEFLPTLEESLKAQEDPDMDPDIKDIGATSPEQAKEQDKEPEKVDHGSGEINEFFPVSDPDQDPGQIQRIEKGLKDLVGDIGFLNFKTDQAITTSMDGTKLFIAIEEEDGRSKILDLDQASPETLAEVEKFIQEEKEKKGS